VDTLARLATNFRDYHPIEPYRTVFNLGADLPDYQRRWHQADLDWVSAAAAPGDPAVGRRSPNRSLRVCDIIRTCAVLNMELGTRLASHRELA
jgi:hypothetical protein